MSELRISIDEFDSAPDDDLLESLLRVVRQLAPESLAAIHSATSEIVATPRRTQDHNVSRFVDALIALAKATDRSFTAVSTLDRTEGETRAVNDPLFAFANEHIVHIRPSEEAAVRAYFQWILGEA